MAKHLTKKVSLNTQFDILKRELFGIFSNSDLRSFLKSIVRIPLRQSEKLKYLTIPSNTRNKFFIVTCTRNPGMYALRCLNSVYTQRYERTSICHLYIDDASTDGTDEQVIHWLSTHPNNSVQYIRRDLRTGGTFNTLAGMTAAPKGSILVELNGDDYFPDNYTLSFLSKIYSNSSVWMTYNTAKHTFGTIPRVYSPYSEFDVTHNHFRESGKWHCGHLRTFRQELLTHLRLESLIDPQTGSLWKNSDDRAIYLPLLELSGHHARHIYRIMCIYNKREASECFVDPEGQADRALRIAGMPKYEPLTELSIGDQFERLAAFLET